jgi:plastocyanin domain-containing protein
VLTVIINSAAILLIALIIWWFWMSKPAAVRAAQQRVSIVVDNGVYTPSTIEVPAGKPVILQFLRKDPSPCAGQVRFEDFSVSLELPVNEPAELTLQPETPGEYPFTCQMQMYRGTLVVK